MSTEPPAVVGIDRAGPGGDRTATTVRAGARVVGGPWEANLTEPLKADRCPLGCALDGERKGTCGAAGRYCIGIMATICEPAHEAWREAGRPTMSREDWAALVPRPKSIEPAEREPAPLPPIFATAPRLGDSPTPWRIYAPHEPGSDGVTLQDAAQREYWDRARKLEHRLGAAMRKTGEPWLLLVGPPGTGKTLLLRILGRAAAELGMDVRYTLFESMVKAVKATRDPASGLREEDVVAGFTAPEILIVDDIRPLFDSQDDENIAHRIIAARYGTDAGEPRKVTWAATNLSIEELVRVVGVAALDRFLHGGTEPWFFVWPSYRPRED